jgi:hypothetical protein
VAEIYLFQLMAISKSIILDPKSWRRHADLNQRATTGKGFFTDALQGGRKNDGFESCTTFEGAVIDIGNTLRDDYPGDTGVVTKSAAANGNDTSIGSSFLRDDHGSHQAIFAATHNTGAGGSCIKF